MPHRHIKTNILVRTSFAEKTSHNVPLFMRFIPFAPTRRVWLFPSVRKLRTCGSRKNRGWAFRVRMDFACPRGVSPSGAHVVGVPSRLKPVKVVFHFSIARHLVKFPKEFQGNDRRPRQKRDRPSQDTKKEDDGEAWTQSLNSGEQVVSASGGHFRIPCQPAPARVVRYFTRKCHRISRRIRL